MIPPSSPPPVYIAVPRLLLGRFLAILFRLLSPALWFVWLKLSLRPRPPLEPAPPEELELAPRLPCPAEDDVEDARSRWDRAGELIWEARRDGTGDGGAGREEWNCEDRRASFGVPPDRSAELEGGGMEVELARGFKEDWVRGRVAGSDNVAEVDVAVGIDDSSDVSITATVVVQRPSQRISWD